MNVYIKAQESVCLVHPEIKIKDIMSLYCTDKDLEQKIKNQSVYHFIGDHDQRKCFSVLMLVEVIKQVDKTLDVIIRLTTNRLKTLLDVEEVPTELEYIVTEVSIVRYNRIGSEGVTNHSVEGETMSFSDNDFKGYLNDIEAWKNKKNEVKGVVKFL